MKRVTSKLSLKQSANCFWINGLSVQHNAKRLCSLLIIKILFILPGLNRLFNVCDPVPPQDKKFTTFGGHGTW